MNSATLKIAIEVDDKGSVKLKQLGQTADAAGDKGAQGLGKIGRSLGEIDGLADKAVSAFKGVAKAGAIIGGAAVLGGLYALTGALKESVMLASDMEEAQSKFDTVFGELSAQAEQWAGTLRESYHMSSLEAKKYLAAMQDLLVPMGMNKQAAAEMSFEVVKLSADLGSFNNLPTAQVMDDIQSALVGNYETMKKYGVVVNEATVQEKALAMGLAATKDEITAADKAQAAYALIVQGSTAAMGDSIRTAGSFANQMRDLTANVTDLKIAAGEALLPVINELVTGLNTWLKANDKLIKSEIKEWAEKLIPIIRGIGEAIVWTVEKIDNIRVGYEVIGDAFGTDVAAESAATYAAISRRRIESLNEEIATQKALLDQENLTAEAREGHQEALLAALDELKGMTWDSAAALAAADMATKKLGTAAGDAASDIADEGEAHGATSKEIDKHASELQKLLDKYLPLKGETEDVAAAQRGLKELYESGAIVLDEYNVALENVRKSTSQYKEDEKQLAEALKATEDRARERKRADEEDAKAAAELSSTYADIYEELADSSVAMSEKSYNARIEALDKELQAKRDQGISEEILDELSVKRTREMYREKLMSSDSFFKGVIAAAMDAEDAMQTMADVGYESFNMLSDTFSQTFVAVMKGEFDSIGDLWESLLDNLLNMFIQFIADLIAHWLMSGIVSMITGASNGGWAGALGGLANGLSGGGGGGGYIGTAASLGSTGYQMYTGESLGGTALGAIAEYLYPQTTVASYVQGGGQYLGEVLGSGSAATGAALTAAEFAELSQLSEGLAAYYGYEVAATTTAEAASPVTTGFGAFSNYIPVIGAVVAAAMNVYSWQERKMAPTQADMFNAQGFRPETFASLISDSFQAATIPFFGETLAKWDVLSDNLFMMTDAEEYKKQKEFAEKTRGGETDSAPIGLRAIHWDEESPTWEMSSDALAAIGFIMNAPIKPQTFEELAAALERMGIAIDSSTVQSIWEWSEASMTSNEQIERSFEELGLGGYELRRSMELLNSATNLAGGTTAELEEYLLSLGYSTTEVAEVLSEYQGNYIEQMRELGNEALPPVLRALHDQFEAYRGLTTELGTNGAKADALGLTYQGLDRDLAALKTGFENMSGTVDKTEDAMQGLALSFADLINLSTIPVVPDEWSTAEPSEGHAAGGLLRGGSGVSDDLYIGTIGGRAQLAMGGEYIMPQEQTRKYLSTLEAMRADRYLLGGPTKGSPPPAPIDRPFTPEPGPSPTRTGTDPAAIAEFMEDILFQIEQIGRSGLDQDLAELERSMAETVARAKELGASEKDLGEIRALGEVQVWQLLQAHKEAQDNFMIGITDQIDAFGMTDQQLAIRETERAMDEQLAKARELGLGEEALAEIRTLQGLKATEIMNEGLQTAITSMSSFRESMADTAAGADRSAESQQELFAVLAQAKLGDFSGVEAIGSALENISLNKEDYASAADYARDYWRTMSAVSELERITTAQVQPQGYADGGVFLGGWRLVGEQGPELEYTGPSRIYSNEQSRALVDNSEVVAEIRELRKELVAGSYQVNKNTGRIFRTLDKWEGIGLPLERAA